jgi:hypothetical protein
MHRLYVSLLIRTDRGEVQGVAKRLRPRLGLDNSGQMVVQNKVVKSKI